MTSQRDGSVVIIGAGLAGLAAGCFAQMNGYRSRIVEHHTQPGGVAAAWRRGDYLIDGGIHFAMGHKPGTALYELYRQLGIVPAVRFADLTSYGRWVHEPTGRSIVIEADLDRLERDMKALWPAEGRIIAELTASARAMQGLDMSTFGLSRPPGLAGPLDQLRELWSMRRMLRYAVGKFGRPVAEYARGTQDPALRSFLESLFLPEVPLFFVSMLLGMLADGQLAYIEGGCHDYVGAIERRYRDLGGEISYGCTVEEIPVRDGRAAGVRLADGSQIQATAVIAACDGTSVHYRMLGGRYVNDKIRQRYATWPRFAPLLMVSYGVSREFPGEPSFQTYVLREPLSIGGRPVPGLMLRLFNYSGCFAPPGKSVIQAEFETGWDYWHDLRVQDRGLYDAEKEAVAARVLERLEVYYPGISSRVEVTDVATPYTTWRYTLNDKGSWEGWLITPQTMRSSVERTLPGLGGFYMAGQWVMPGGGVPAVLYSGQHAVQLLCRDDGRPFVAA
jgi:phytoene dehydrogenase-like protein